MSGHGTAGVREEYIELLGLERGLGMEDPARRVDRFVAGGGLRMIVDVRMGESGTIPGSSKLVGELTEGIIRGGRWFLSSDVIGLG